MTILEEHKRQIDDNKFELEKEHHTNKVQDLNIEALRAEMNKLYELFTTNDDRIVSRIHGI